MTRHDVRSTRILRSRLGGSRFTLGRHLRFRGEAATIVATGIAVGTILLGSAAIVASASLIVLASATVAAARARTPLPREVQPESAGAIATIRPSAPSLPRA